MVRFVSRAGQKLDHALGIFAVDVAGRVCADLGCSTGGFTDCLLRRGAARIFAVDTGYGVLDYTLRKNPKVITMERTNAMHVELPEKMDLITIDVAWTRQKNILPHAKSLLKPGGRIVSLIKPHYEAEASLLQRGVLAEEHQDSTLQQLRQQLEKLELKVLGETRSPVRGAKGNAEHLWLLATN